MSRENFKLITKENIAEEHICCAFSDKKSVAGYEGKKELIKKRIAEGFHFVKLDERGKVFIEYVPAEFAWAPIDAAGYVFIHCFWVSGKFKGQGYAKKLLAECEKFAKQNNKKGIVAITSNKKMPFISDKKFFTLQGFQVCDTADPYFELVVKKYIDKSEDPRFRKNAKSSQSKFRNGLEIIYSDLCPFNEFHSREILKYAVSMGIDGKLTKINTLNDAKNVNAPTALFNIFYNGEFITHEILTEKRFQKLFSELI